GLSDTDAAMVSAELTACWTWRQSKVLYSFDAELVDVLRAQAEDIKDSDVLPAELLLHLPHPCVYVKAPGLLEHTDGFFAWTDYDVNRDGAELRIQWLADDMAHTFAQVLHIADGWTLHDCLTDTARHTAEALGSDPDDAGDLSAKDARVILSAVQLLLYLVSQDADVTDAPSAPKPQRTPQPAKTVRLIRDKAGDIDAKDVGVRVGAAIRKARVRYEQRKEAAGPGGVKRPHPRRGHWHHYWTGPKDTPERKLILKWTAPTFIHADDFDGENVVAYTVRRDHPKQ
ncbi:MAG: hypothetical protein Q4P84_05370, partial [Elusimicrobiales bacterium]|nr:hypothetical protein [Elusimicrobiales bacterium]